MVTDYRELKVLSNKLRASFYHIFVLYHNQPPNRSSAIPSFLGGGRNKSNTIPSGRRSPQTPFEGIPRLPVASSLPPGLSPISIPKPSASFLLPARDYTPDATKCFAYASQLGDYLLSGSHPIRLSVKTEYAAYLYDSLHDPEASRKLAQSAIRDVYNAKEGMDDDMFEDAAELVSILGRMMKRGEAASEKSSTPRVGSSTPRTRAGSTGTPGSTAREKTTPQTTPRDEITPKGSAKTSPRAPKVPSPPPKNERRSKPSTPKDRESRSKPVTPRERDARTKPVSPPDTTTRTSRFNPFASSKPSPRRVTEEPLPSSSRRDPCLPATPSPPKQRRSREKIYVSPLHNARSRENLRARRSSERLAAKQRERERISPPTSSGSSKRERDRVSPLPTPPSSSRHEKQRATPINPPRLTTTTNTVTTSSPAKRQRMTGNGSKISSPTQVRGYEAYVDPPTTTGTAPIASTSTPRRRRDATNPITNGYSYTTKNLPSPQLTSSPSGAASSAAAARQREIERMQRKRLPETPSPSQQASGGSSGSRKSSRRR